MTVLVDSAPAKVNNTVYNGDDWTRAFTFNKAGGAGPIDLTGTTVTAAARSTLGVVTDLVASVVGDPLNGTVQIAPPTGGLGPDVYDYDVQIEDAAGAVTSWVRGRLKVVQDVTA